MPSAQPRRDAVSGAGPEDPYASALLAAHETEQRMAAIFASALDCIVTMDGAGRIVAFNPAAERTFGVAAAAVVGRDMADALVPEDLRARHRAGLARYLGGGEPEILDRRVETEAVDASGRRFPVELTITRVALDGPPLFTGYLRDITDRNAARAELRSSRARVVTAGDEARRRLERDLHDGAQQRLVALSMTLGLARARWDADPVAARALVDEATGELHAAITELRDLARGIHPAVLTEGGVAPAVRMLARRSSIPVVLAGDPGERMAAHVEATAYFFVAEALTNAERHAGATRVEVELGREPGRLVVAVRDDGRGGADPEGGTGLWGMWDRISAVDGRLDVDSPPGAGTRLRAELPCAS